MTPCGEPGRLLRQLACIAIGIQVPRCDMSYAPPHADADGEGILWLTDHRSRSWARLHHHLETDGPYRVYQLGARRLWDEVTAAYLWWVDQGCPGADRWRFHIGPRSSA